MNSLQSTIQKLHALQERHQDLLAKIDRVEQQQIVLLEPGEQILNAYNTGYACGTCAGTGHFDCGSDYPTNHITTTKIEPSPERDFRPDLRTVYKLPDPIEADMEKLRQLRAQATKPKRSMRSWTHTTAYIVMVVLCMIAMVIVDTAASDRREEIEERTHQVYLDSCERSNSWRAGQREFYRVAAKSRVLKSERAQYLRIADGLKPLDCQNTDLP